jgi:DNA-3-methyladenine glycosylase II
VAAGLDRLLGLRIGLDGFYRLAEVDSHLHSLARRFMGFRPPRYLSMFEALVNAVACQQITLTQGIRLLARLAGARGKVSPSGGRAFPEPRDLAGLDIPALRTMGFSTNKARAILGIAEAALDGRLAEPGGLEGLDNEAAIGRLRTLRGVGRWTAEYALLRGSGRLDLFPAEDAGVRNNLRRWLQLAEPPTYPEVRTIMGRFAPYAGVVYFHLLLDHLEDAGYLPASG